MSERRWQALLLRMRQTLPAWSLQLVTQEPW